ncbi:cupin domain-containing protein [Micromonospora sp. WMMD712]|uniref:JmjC domain-containing protein n=1 Tax=Micromonospora sp. WMMD712 TaxID=3016096 RepID=UPI002499D78D|nr:cupin domain-containing protein [Micromonospora sp. WMMD712]WFE58605.1 cupin domain-containing protein [Micromonospora sp. WMMD712]
MSLTLLLPEAGVRNLMTNWPDQIHVYDSVPAALDREINATTLYEWIDTGCVPAAEIAVVKAPNPSLNAASFSTNGRTDGPRLRNLLDNGFTVRFGHMERISPAMHRLAHGVQQETGYSTFVHAFVTPPGEQGLRHHWDQQMTLAIQLAGTKRWDCWKPLYPAPTRDYHDSSKIWQEKWRQQWTAAGPDFTHDLKAGEVLVLPRGWVHNPRNISNTETSIHLTVAIGERTPYWIAEEMVKTAIHDPTFRAIIPPSGTTVDGLRTIAEQTRDDLINHLQNLDATKFADTLHHLSRTTLEYTH